MISGMPECRYQEAEAVLVRSLGAEEVMVADVRVCLGGVYVDQGEYGLALNCYSDALGLYVRAGSSGLMIAAQHRRIGEVYRKQVSN